MNIFAFQSLDYFSIEDYPRKKNELKVWYLSYHQGGSCTVVQGSCREWVLF